MEFALRHPLHSLALVAALLACGCDEPQETVSARPPAPHPTPHDSATTPEEVARAVCAGRTWLASTQNDNGSWNCDSCGLPDSVSLTGLAVVALVDGEDPHFRDAVQAGATWLTRVQRKDGSFPAERFEEQAIGLWALARASTKNAEHRQAAERSLAWIAKVQAEHGGFDKDGAAPENAADTAVTAWVLLGLLEAQATGFEGATAPLQRSAECLASNQSIKSYPAAARLLARIVLGRSTERLAAETLPGKLSPDSRHGSSVGDMTFTLFVATAAPMVGDTFLAEYRRACPGTLCRLQETRRTDGEGHYVEGSWSPEKHMGGNPRSRTALTAMAILCLTSETWAPPPPPPPVW